MCCTCKYYRYYFLFRVKPTRCTLLLSKFISTSVHVSGNYVPIMFRTYCNYSLQTRQPPIQSKKFQCCINTVSSPDDGHIQTYLLTYLLTPWCRVLLEKLTGFAASQQIPRISQNPKVHYSTHKRPPNVCNMGQPNPVHTSGQVRKISLPPGFGSPDHHYTDYAIRPTLWTYVYTHIPPPGDPS